MSGKSAEEQRLQAVLRIHKMRMLPVGTTQMGRKTDVMIADGSHLLLYLGRKPDIILIAESHKIARCLHRSRLEILIESQIAGIAREMYDRILLGIGCANRHRIIRRTIILDDDLLQGIGLREYGIQLLPDIFGTIVGAHND